jgi:hypothetical protein
VNKSTQMDSGECDKQEDAGDSLPSDSNIPKPFWVRHIGLQTDTINQRLLAYNVRVVCFCGPILWFLLYLI